MRLAKVSRSRTAPKIDLAACLVMAHSRATWRATRKTREEDKEFRRMTQDDTLLQRLDEPAARYAELDRYYTGRQPLAFLSPEAKTALRNRFGRMASNIPRLAVTALAERLRITGFTGDDGCAPIGSAMISTRRRVSRTAKPCCSATAT